MWGPGLPQPIRARLSVPGNAAYAAPETPPRPPCDLQSALRAQTVAGEIVERVRQAVDGELGHRGRERRLAANLAASAMAASKAMPGSATSSLRRPCLD